MYGEDMKGRKKCYNYIINSKLKYLYNYKYHYNLDIV